MAPEITFTPNSRPGSSPPSRARGKTFEEIAAFAGELRERAVQPVLDAATRARGILDVCGTGGDRLNTFNISTSVALVASAAGVTVAKHGNRAITSQAGSADVLEALGIRVDLPPDAGAAWLRAHHFAFFFAPNYHPAFRHIAPAQRFILMFSAHLVGRFKTALQPVVEEERNQKRNKFCRNRTHGRREDDL